MGLVDTRELESRVEAHIRALDLIPAPGGAPVEPVLYPPAPGGAPQTISPRREDGVVRPLLPLWRAETEGYCHAYGLPYREDSSNVDTVRGLIRNEILPLLRRLHPAAD